MSAFSTLLALINAQIKTNGLKAITGAKLNGVLVQMVNELGSGYQFIDIATPATDPGTPDENVWYIASQAGTYTNFGGIIVNENEVCALVWNGSWTKKVTGAATAAQVSQLGQEVYDKVYSIPFNLSGFYLKSGKFTPTPYWRATGLFSVSVGDVINVRQRVNQGDMSVLFFDENKRILSSSPLADNNVWSERTCVVPENAFYAAVHSVQDSGETMFAVSSANIKRLLSDAILAVQKEGFSIINKVLQVIPPVLGDDWSIYSQNLSNNQIYANRQSEVVRVSGIRFKFFSVSGAINTIRVYLMDITDTSSLTLLKEIKDASEVDICYFDTPILVGGNKQIFVGGNGVMYANQVNSGLVYLYNIEQNILSSNNQVCMAYELILNATISERISALENTKNNIIIDNNDLIAGFWYRNSLQTGDVFNNLRTCRNAIAIQDCLITYSGSDANKAVWGFSLYDSSMNPLGNYPQNKPFYGGSIAIRMREILFFYPTATYFRVNWGILDNGTWLPMPSDAKMNVQKAEYKPIIIVDKTGVGDYLTITDAVMNAFDNLDAPVEISIHNGIYNEFIYVGSNRYLSFKGENKHRTIMESHTGQYVDAPIWIDGDFTIENMTLKMLDDSAPSDWTPGNSQTDRQTMLPGYALHVDGGNGSFPPLNGEYKLGVVRNCILYSVANAAMGCGLHGNNKVIFENCDFIRNVSNDDYLTYTGDYGAFLVHDALAGEVEENQRLVMLYCRYISNLNSAAKLDMSHSTDTSNVEIQAIGNSFYAGASDDNAIVFVRNNSVLHKISNQNNNALLNP